MFCIMSMFLLVELKFKKKEKNLKVQKYITQKNEQYNTLATYSFNIDIFKCKRWCKTCVYP